jgi:hypothetical protein
VAGLSLLTKYVIRYRGSHVFNPSNIGLVVAFVLLGPSRAEPLDFWWAPLEFPMIAAYAVIITGGLLITRRLQLLALAATFWIGLTVGVGILAASGHCMTANWAFAPVCGLDFWRVIVTSPEVLVFLFFMITDPKTIPVGRVARVAFGLAVAVTSTLLMAPQTDEFGTKVGLLAGLVVVCAARPLLERFLPEPKSMADDLRRYAARLVTGDAGAGAGTAARLGLIAVSAVLIGAAIVAAGTPARGVVAVNVAEILNRVPHHIDPATLPSITVSRDVLDFDHTLGGPAGQQLVLTLAENLEIEAQALLRGDDTLLAAVDHGDRLAEMQERLERARATGTTVVERYAIDAVTMSLLVPFGQQTGASIGMESRGTVTVETYDAAGALVSRHTSPYSLTFAMRRATGDRWLNVAVLPEGQAPG